MSILDLPVPPAPVDLHGAAGRLGRLSASAPETTGYMISSMELWAGLDVRPLALSALPDDTLRELLRLRGSWQAPARRLA